MSQRYIKPKNAFALPFQTVTFVPSTTNKSEPISDEEFKRRTIEVKKYLSKLFGGYTSVKSVGGYVLKGKTIEEKINQVSSFSTMEAFKKNREKFYRKLRVWKRAWKQDSVGVVLEDDLFYIS